MQIIDTTNKYLDYLSDKNKEKYFLSYPSLFDHYFYFWAKKDEFKSILNADQVKNNLRIIKKALPNVQKSIENFFQISLDDQRIILFVGSNTTNGHVFRDTDDKFIVWIPIESYISEKRAKIFLTHEIIHALYYKRFPELYFKNKEDMLNIKNCLLTEGVATYLTSNVCKVNYLDALYADYVSTEQKKHLSSDYQNKKKEIKRYIFNNLNKIDTLGLFNATDSGNVLNYKGGQMLGTLLLKEAVNKKLLNTQDIIGTNPKILLDSLKKV